MEHPGETHSFKTERKFILIAVLLYLVTAWFSEGYYHSDEHYQIIEFAEYKLGNNTTSDLAWEFSDRIRPGLQPAIAYGVISSFRSIVADDPFIIAAFLRIVSGLLFLFALIFFTSRVVRFFESHRWRRYLWLLSLFFWFLPFIGVRFSSESWSATCMLVAMGMLMQKDVSLRQVFAVGLMLGLAFQFRYQSVFMTAGILLWFAFMDTERIRKLALMIAGFFAVMIIGAITDRWLYGNWAFPLWDYFYVNIIEGKASSYGVEPWWFYFNETAMKAIYPIGILVMLSIIYFVIRFPKHLLIWAIVPFLALHFITPHKELRFLFPLAVFVPFIIATVLYDIRKRYAGKRISGIMMNCSWRWAFWIITLPLLLTMAYKPADPNISQLNFINSNYGGKKVTLYYYKDNPYNPFCLDLHFYRFQGAMKLIEIKTPEEIDSIKSGGEIVLLKTKRSNEKELGIDSSRFEIVYESTPGWLEFANFNGWMDRSAIHRVYVLK